MNDLDELREWLRSETSENDEFGMMAKALNTVLDLHLGYVRGAWGRICDHCNTEDGGYVQFPCPTVMVITEVFDSGGTE